MLNDIYNIKGIKYILPPEIYSWQHIEKTLKNLINSYGYKEIKLPIIEKTSLFTRTLGKHSDIIEKEMFSFIDKNNTSLTLLPEGTASCTKALINKGLIRNKQRQKYWYIGPMFRRENPQTGRQRQFYQVGLETYGFKNNFIDIEQILIINKLFTHLNLTNIHLETNCLGNNNTIEHYKKDLTNYLKKNTHYLNANNKTHLYKNPLRILENINTKNILHNMPILLNYIPSETKKEFFNTINYLKLLNIPVYINNSLVRGLDYYNDLVYEWTTTSLGKKLTLCAGGRYDNLTKQLKGPKTYSTGCALGIERLLLLLNKKQIDFKPQINSYIIFNNNKSININLNYSEKIRNYLPTAIILNGENDKNIKNQLKKAIKLNIKNIIILSDTNITNKTLTIKNLQTNKQNITKLVNIKNHIKT